MPLVAARKKNQTARPVAPLRFIEPMKATLVDEPPTHGEWDYELKFDGYRALAMKSGKNVQLVSRNEKDFSVRFPEIAEAVKAMKARDAILDGEIVALDPKGRSSFQLLQGIELDERPPLMFYVFDLLSYDGNDLRDKPLRERRKRLQALLKNVKDPIRYSATISGDPHQLLAEVKKIGLEGLIGKERHSLYEAGRRSPSWIKLKCVQEQEFVIGGYTPPEGARQHFGALLIGVFDGKKKLLFSGKVGTGFNDALLRSLHANLRKLHQDKCPFADLPEKRQGRWHQNITPAEMSRCHWVKPRLVCQVRFTEWTEDGKLRHPAFLGLREDKNPAEVVRESPA